MNNNFWKKNIAIIIFTICVLVIIIYRVKYSYDKTDNNISVEENIVENNDKVQNEEENDKNSEDAWKDVTDINVGYTVQKIIQDFVNIDTTVHKKVIIESIKEKEIDQNFSCFVAKFIVENIKTQEFVIEEYLIKINWNTKYFYAEKLKENNEVDKLNLTNNIEQKDEYMFTTYDLSDEKIARFYLENIKYRILYDADSLYNLLDKDYKEKRFKNSKEEFNKYINSSKELYRNIILSRYNIENVQNQIKCILVDNMDNYFTLKITNVTEYTVMLDDYTIETDEYIKIYDEATIEEKISTNIVRFFQRINLKDYVGAYGLLNETFKKNNFDTLEKFEQYAKDNFYEYTVVDTIQEIKKSGAYYACIVNTKSGVNLSSYNSKETFIVYLKEGTEFELSFTIK